MLKIILSYLIITTAQLHSTKPELRFCPGSNPAHGVSEIRDGEDLWQWSRLEIRLKLLLLVNHFAKTTHHHHHHHHQVSNLLTSYRMITLNWNQYLLLWLSYLRKRCWNMPAFQTGCKLFRRWFWSLLLVCIKTSRHKMLVYINS